MKLYTSALLVILFAVMASCSYDTTPKRVPPGQAKKMTGSQSAKPFAPGQQKKL